MPPPKRVRVSWGFKARSKWVVELMEFRSYFPPLSPPPHIDDGNQSPLEKGVGFDLFLSLIGND